MKGIICFVFSYVYTYENGKTTSEILVTSDEERAQKWLTASQVDENVKILGAFRSLSSLKNALNAALNPDVKDAMRIFYKRRKKNPGYIGYSSVVPGSVISMSGRIKV